MKNYFINSTHTKFNCFIYDSEGDYCFSSTIDYRRPIVSIPERREKGKIIATFKPNKVINFTMSNTILE